MGAAHYQRAKRLPHGQHDARRDPLRHGTAGARARPQRHRRQDRHDQRPARRLVRRVQSGRGRGGVGRLRCPPSPRCRRDRRPRRPANVERLHARGTRRRARSILGAAAGARERAHQSGVRPIGRARRTRCDLRDLFRRKCSDHSRGGAVAGALRRFSRCARAGAVILSEYVMTRRGSNHDARMRQSIAIEAARIMSEEHLTDFYKAKHKAAARLGAADTRNLPRNDEIERALVEYQRLFRADSQPAKLKALRETALHAMHLLARFKPRLVGAVLRGTADEHSEITLHVYADTPEEPALFLMEQHIPYQHVDKRLSLASGEPAIYPAYRFLAEETPLLLVVLPPIAARQAFKSEVDGRPLQRANAEELRVLLESS